MTRDDDQLRPATDDDWAAVDRLLTGAFHHDVDPESGEAHRAVYEPDRALLAWDGDLLVGHAAAYSRTLTVPGTVLPAAHIAMVAVAATHRRQGVLSRLMRRQLHDLRAGGQESLAVLWASEGRIYPRFGYGLAAPRVSLEIESREVRPHVDWQLPAWPAGRLRSGAPETLRAELRTVHDRQRPHRPGWSSRDERWWDWRLADPPARRLGVTARRAVVHETADGPTGYALWRARSGWDASGPRCEVQVEEVVSTDPAAYARLWGFLLGMDLVRTAHQHVAAPDEPLLYLVPELRRLGVTLSDGLWVRLVDIAAALAGRRYAAPVDVVLELTDPLLPENTGRWRLTGDPAGATCARTTDPADLSLGVADLGAAYLGGPSLMTLAAAGRVRELRPGALPPASHAFGWYCAPVGLEIF